jgi:hypothetical protein
MRTWRNYIEQPPHAWIAVVAGLRVLLWLALGAPTSPRFSQAALLALVLAFAGASVLLVWGARDRDPRARALAFVYLLIASTYTDWGVLAEPRTVGWLGPIMQLIQPKAFLAYAIWSFCFLFPRVPQFPQEINRLKSARFAAYVVGVVLFLVSAVPYTILAQLESAGASLLEWLHAGSASRGFWNVIGLASLPAIVAATLRTRRAPKDERRRVSLMLFAIVIGGVPPLLLPLIVNLVPALPAFEDPKASLLYTFIEYSGLFLMLVGCGYAILARRALDVRFIVRRTLQYALARNVVLTVTALPFIALALVVYQNRERAVGELFADSKLAVLLGCTITGLALVRFRLHAGIWLDRTFFREQYDARRILAQLVERVREAGDPGTLARISSAEIDRALHVERVALLYGSARRPFLVSGSSVVRPLSTDSGLLSQLRSATQPLDIDWEPPSAFVQGLQPEDRSWLADAGFRLLLPLHAGDRRVIGVLGLGEKRSELPYSREDRELLVAIAGALALALENRLLVEESDGRRPGPDESPVVSVPPKLAEERIGRVCSDCGIVQEAGHPRCEHCGGQFEDGEYPLLLAGKFQLMERVGRGGMGIVFRARDRTLGRDVAIKTLPEVGADRSARLRREARAMAALTHPSLALILGAEVWHGTPFLVFEYLPGGTLSDRLRKGPLGEPAAIGLGVTLANVLDRVHAAGILHRDVKPSNIGYALDGTPKLLDFGLAKLVGIARSPYATVGGGASRVAAMTSLPGTGVAWTTEAGATLTAQDDLVGTLLYLSPEALNGAPADRAVDLWSTNVVLYECVAGQHPFDGAGRYAVVTNVLTQQVPDIRSFQPTVSGRLAAYFHDALARDVRRRPKSAKEIRDRLQRAA